MTGLGEKADKTDNISLPEVALTVVYFWTSKLDK